MNSDLDQRRARFGERLRQIREHAGFHTGTAFAALLGWHQSRVSRIETGTQLPTDSDLITWLDTMQVSEPVAVQMRKELLELRLESASWKRQLRTGNRPRQEGVATGENTATSIRAFETVMVPGLVQTPEYATHMFATNAAFYNTSADVDELVRVRMERQRVLFDSSKTIELVVTQTALCYPICPPEVMATQLDRLLAIVGLPSVTFGIIPLGTRLPVAPIHGFWIIYEQVLIETIDTEITLTDPDDLVLYHRMADAMRSVAVTGEVARAILLRIAGNLRTTGLAEPPPAL